MTATEYQLQLLSWQFFITLTWNESALGSARSRENAVWAWFRNWAIREGCQLAQLPIALRWERGELGDRPHAHALIGGLPARSVSMGTCFRQMRLWTPGFARLWVYDPDTSRGNAQDYLTKLRAVRADRSRAMKYELGKFDYCDRLVVSEAAWSLMQSVVGADHRPQHRTA